MSDVPDATKWVDELRDDEPVAKVCHNLPQHIGWNPKITHLPDEGTLLYAAPTKPDLLTQTCCECGKSGGYALYCGECWEKATKREWQGLTDEEIDYIWGITKPDYEDKFDFPRAIEAALKYKNGF